MTEKKDLTEQGRLINMQEDMLGFLGGDGLMDKLKNLLPMVERNVMKDLGDDKYFLIRIVDGKIFYFLIDKAKAEIKLDKEAIIRYGDLAEFVQSFMK
jgi:hypothetical protein